MTALDCNRRLFLKALCALPAVNGARWVLPSAIPLSIWPSRANAEPSTIIAAITIATAVVQMMKRSGDLRLEFSAVHIKLDALLNGQKMILAAIREINSGLEQLADLIPDIPTETVGLELAGKIGGIYKQLTNNLTSLKKSPGDIYRRNEYNKLREDLKSEVSSLYSAIQVGGAIPVHVHAAQFATQTIQLFYSHDRELKLWSNNSRDDLLNIIGELQDVLSLLVGNKTESKSGALYSRISKFEESIQVLWDSASKSSYWIFVEQLALEKSIKKVGDKPSENKTKKMRAICMRGPTNITNVRHQNYVVEYKSDTRPVYSWVNDYRHEVPLFKIPYKVDRYIAYGGRPLYNVQRTSKKKWTQLTWSMTTRVAEGHQEVLSTDPIHTLEACTQLPGAANGALELFSHFMDFLKSYTAHVAIESRLLALRDEGKRTLETCEHLERQIQSEYFQ